MNATLRGVIAGFAAAFAIVLIVFATMQLMKHPEGVDVNLSVSSSFTEALDLDEFRLLAVQDRGRIKAFDSLAREQLKYVSRRALRQHDAVVLYFDLLFTPQNYTEQPCLVLGKKPFSAQFVQTLRSLVPADRRVGVISEAELARIEETRVVSPRFLDHPASREVISQLERDVLRMKKPINQLRNAQAYASSRVLSHSLRVVPPATGEIDQRWHTIDEAARGGGMPRDAMHRRASMPSGIPGLDSEVSEKIAAAWLGFGEAWRFQDAAKANEHLASLSALLPQVAGDAYPEGGRLEWEHWYYRQNKLTWGWLIFFFAIPFLLMGFVYKIRFARWAGLGLFVLGFGLQTFSIALRWWLAGRIPNANMYEAILASAWFGSLLAIVLEWVLRKHRVFLLSAFGASAYAMVAMMYGRFMTVQLNGDITTVMPVLDRTIWLYIHTNVIIASYALIFFAAITATGYMIYRLMAYWREGPATSQRLAIAAAGGAGSVILGGLKGGAEKKQNMGRVLDGATMIFLEVAFVSLWVGTILGAVWADVSWGRPWGWDPKEVFALNTWLVFLLLVHVRLKVKDKGLWTAVLALVGCAVMLFNWIAVNFIIVGLHSYA